MTARRTELIRVKISGMGECRALVWPAGRGERVERDRHDEMTKLLALDQSLATRLVGRDAMWSYSIGWQNGNTPVTQEDTRRHGITCTYASVLMPAINLI